jgi:hypothetical protein
MEVQYENHNFERIDTNRIVNRDFIKLERLQCNICKCVLKDMKKCSLCFAHFCSECINQSKNDNNYCPSCRTHDFKIEEGEAYLQKFINEILISCIYQSKGCGEVCFYENISEHEKICKFREKFCDNCKTEMPFEYYYQHIIDCFKFSEIKDQETKQKKILSLVKAFDDKICKVKYDNKYGINQLKLEMQKNLSKLDEKIRTLEKYCAEQDYLIKSAGMEKLKMKTPLEMYGKNLKECQTYYYCKGGYNGCNKTGNVWGSNPYTSDSVICLGALHSGHITKEGGLFIVKKGGALDNYIGSIKNGVSTQTYGSFDHMLIMPSELNIKLNFTNNQCGPRIGICKGKINGCNEKGDVWGDNPYIRESNLCKAALHSGLITENGGIFMIEESGTHGGYPGLNKNGITSLPCSSNRSSITIKPFLPY